jgi:hypothetical protein
MEYYEEKILTGTAHLLLHRSRQFKKFCEDCSAFWKRIYL